MSKHRAVHARSIGRRWVAVGVSLATAAGFSIALATPAFATSVSVNDVAHLRAALTDSTNDTVVLGASITVSDGGNVSVSSTLAKTLDLNGQHLAINSV